MRHSRINTLFLGLALVAGSQSLPALPIGSPGLGPLGPALPAPGGLQRQLPGPSGLVAPGHLAQPSIQPLGTLIERVPLPEQPLGKLPARIELPEADGGAGLVDVEVEGGLRAIQREWLLLLDDQAWQGLLEEAPQLAAMLVEQERFSALGKTLLRLRVPAELDSIGALRAALPPRVRRYLDRNHVYAPQTGQPGPPDAAEPVGVGVCAAPLKVGMIDTALDTGHEVFAGLEQRVISRDFLLAEGEPPLAHGTAVAALLVGQGPGVRPLLPQARLHAASVFYRQDALRQGATLLHLLQALEWLVAQEVSLINMSLAGPDNAVLRQAVESVLARGVQIVAAAGNAGPAAPPQFPAGYPEVVAVTAVDAQDQPYRWAGRGPHIDFAAPGVKILTARAGSGYAAESGTSMAAPVVTAFFGCALFNRGGDRQAAWVDLLRLARDIGEPGTDPVTGHGLLDPKGPFPRLPAHTARAAD